MEIKLLLITSNYNDATALFPFTERIGQNFRELKTLSNLGYNYITLHIIESQCDMYSGISLLNKNLVRQNLKGLVDDSYLQVFVDLIGDYSEVGEDLSTGVIIGK